MNLSPREILRAKEDAWAARDATRTKQLIVNGHTLYLVIAFIQLLATHKLQFSLHRLGSNKMWFLWLASIHLFKWKMCRMRLTPNRRICQRNCSFLGWHTIQALRTTYGLCRRDKSPPHRSCSHIFSVMRCARVGLCFLFCIEKFRAKNKRSNIFLWLSRAHISQHPAIPHVFCCCVAAEQLYKK